MIDSHCHLAASQFAEDLEAVIARASAAGVERMVCIGDTLKESEEGLRLANKHEHIFCTVGLHPHHAKDFSDEAVTTIRSLASSSKKVRAIGEIGLDYHYDFSPRDVQRSAFRAQLELAKGLHMPVVVHCRKAVEDVWSIVDEIKPEKLVIHCCTEKWSDVERFVKRGYLLSFTGIATYPKSEDIRDTIRQCPLEQMMVETDAPFLPPEAVRAKGGRSVRNEPAFVIEVAKCVAEIKGVLLAQVDRATTEAAERFFGLHNS